MTFLKNFFDWVQQKKSIDKKIERFRFKEREVWYMHVGVNVGFEIDGKGVGEFLRPCLVIKKMSQDTFYALPLTTKLKQGSWYFPSFVNGKEGRYIFSQMRVLDAKRLKYFVETVPEQEFINIKSQFTNFFNT
jgi:hypothetical protein